MSLGATHFTHWFQPLTGATAEKHDSFIEWGSVDSVIEEFSGKQLIQGEPDASSFPSGGLRNTYEARGYTGWDPSSPAFVWEAGDGVTLCVPSVFFSYSGEALDSKIPLLRSEEKINTAVMRLLKHTGTKASYVYTTLGWEQEYFVIDRALRNLRPDLVMLGKTVYGAPPAKGQEMEDHYFGAVKDRVLNFMQDFEERALDLGIPVKTRHNEVAPAQHEVAPVFEKSVLAVDHNILLMELMRQTALHHDLACLLHEKPFAELNGSGKHNNWSLSTDTGINLLDPSQNSDSTLRFLVLLTAVLNGVHEHADLVRASVGSAANDYRLGGHEAPPAIISVYLGEALEAFLDDIEAKGSHSPKKVSKVDLKIPAIPPIPKDNTDRNRTSPFAFTGQKFEFRAVGSGASCALPVTVLNSVVADSLNTILDEIESKLGKKSSPEAFAGVAMPVIRKYVKKSRDIRFSGNNYSPEWLQEAEKRGLPNIQKSLKAFAALKTPKSHKVFEEVLSKAELASRYEIMVEDYAKTMNIEARLMLELFRTQILPAALKHQKNFADSLASLKQAGAPASLKQKSILTAFSKQLDDAITAVDRLESEQKKAASKEGKACAEHFCNKVFPSMKKARHAVDALEGHVDDSLWPLPKYREMLFLV